MRRAGPALSRRLDLPRSFLTVERPGLALQPPLDRALGRPGLLARRRRRLGRLRRPVPSAARAHPRGCVPGCGNGSASMTMTPSLVARWPASFMVRARTRSDRPGALRGVEAQLHGRRDLVDVLAAGAGRADEILRQGRPSMDDGIVGDDDRSSSRIGHAAVHGARQTRAKEKARHRNRAFEDMRDLDACGPTQRLPGCAAPRPARQRRHGSRTSRNCR